jgi:dethiobiotin synthetase
MARPRRLVLVTGTGTEIGKTWVGCALLGQLRGSGLAVAARKPAQSFDRGDDPAGLDAALLAAAAGSDPDRVCPPERTYPLAMAPPMAAAALGRPAFTIADLAAEATAGWPDPAADVGLVEGAGGVAAPQADDGDTVDLARALTPDLVVLVAPAGLGTINVVRLSVWALRPWPVVVHLSPWVPAEPLPEANRRWLVERDGLTVTTSVDDLAAIVVGDGPLPAGAASGRPPR